MVRLIGFVSALVLAACTQPASVQTTAAADAGPAPPQAAPPQATAAPAAPARRNARARVCETPRMGPYRAGSGAPPAAMTVSNEGGWCGKGYSNGFGRSFSGGNVIEPPAHGEARVRHLPRRSLLEYRPTPGYAGSDRFTATLTPDGGTYIVEVTVRP